MHYRKVERDRQFKNVRNKFRDQLDAAEGSFERFISQ